MITSVNRSIIYKQNPPRGHVVQEKNMLPKEKPSAISDLTSPSKDADLPPTYATLPTIKLEEEPNPFDQSFEGAAKIVPLPPETEIKRGAQETTQQLNDMFYKNAFDNKPKKIEGRKRVKKTNKMEAEDDMKRKNFLERNRIAALKCRQRKKQWLQNLQTKVEYLTADNEQYHLETNALRQELISLRALLMSHKDCPVNQQAIANALNQPLPGLTQPYEYINNMSVLQTKRDA